MFDVAVSAYIILCGGLLYVSVRTLGIRHNYLFPFPPPPQCSEHQTLGQRELCAVLCCSSRGLSTDAYIEGMFEAWQRGPDSVHTVCACVCARARVGEGGRDGPLNCMTNVDTITSK